jgi:8-oxo-dGTP diphosphatase
MSALIANGRREILKVGLAVMDGPRILLVRKKGGYKFILPGGKPEKGENDVQTLRREIEEELGCGLDDTTVEFLGTFTDVAADTTNAVVTVRLYAARLVGTPSPHAEIETLEWISAAGKNQTSLAPSLENQILPFLYSQGRLSAT